MNRLQLGSERIGDPVMEARRALFALVERKAWADFNWKPVNYYYDRMICARLLELMDSALSDDQLEAVKPADVSLLVLLLLRDVFRHHSGQIRPAPANADWVESLFQEVASVLGLSVEAIKDDGQPYQIDIEKRKDAGWAESLAAPFGLPALKLFVCHSAIVTGVTEDEDSDGDC